MSVFIKTTLLSLAGIAALFDTTAAEARTLKLVNNHATQVYVAMSTYHNQTNPDGTTTPVWTVGGWHNMNVGETRPFELGEKRYVSLLVVNANNLQLSGNQDSFCVHNSLRFTGVHTPNDPNAPVGVTLFDGEEDSSGHFVNCGEEGSLMRYFQRFDLQNYSTFTIQFN